MYFSYEACEEAMFKSKLDEAIQKDFRVLGKNRKDEYIDIGKVTIDSQGLKGRSLIDGSTFKLYGYKITEEKQDKSIPPRNPIYATKFGDIFELKNGSFVMCVYQDCMRTHFISDSGEYSGFGFVMGIYKWLEREEALVYKKAEEVELPFNQKNFPEDDVVLKYLLDLIPLGVKKQLEGKVET